MSSVFVLLENGGVYEDHYTIIVRVFEHKAYADKRCAFLNKLSRRLNRVLDNLRSNQKRLYYSSFPNNKALAIMCKYNPNSFNVNSKYTVEEVEYE